ncbi:SAICAR synthetase [Mycena floridula]|nr:SAICAR synthetase [Mycena floridula]
MASDPVLETNLATLPLLSRGKVRDIYSLPSAPNCLLFVASDRISAYDVVLKNGIPRKGLLLTQISAFWFEKLKHIVPNHVLATDLFSPSLPEQYKDVQQDLVPYRNILQGRSMLVKKAKVVKLEAIVRGYVTGSAWSEYKSRGTVHGMALPPGLRECEKLPKPLFTPSTKADIGEHDENIGPEQAAKIVGSDLYERVSSIALQIYEEASAYALDRGIILADTKFEFGLVAEGDSEILILIDELLTPDSSRYWPADTYEPGRQQQSFDKQYLRDWLVESGFKKGLESGPPGKADQGWEIAPEVVEGTRKRYEDVVQLLIG